MVDQFPYVGLTESDYGINIPRFIDLNLETVR